jgi:fumarylpyruvate hydrolase
VNEAERQHGDLSQLIWNVPEIVSKLSQQYELKPGDLIYTGTPAGVGPVNSGDSIQCTIEALGSLRVTIA